MRNTLKQAIVLWGMVLLLVLWSVFISPSGVLRWAGAAAIVLAVAALLIYRRRQAWTEMTGDAGLSSLPPETYRQPVVLVCGGLSAHLFTDSPVRQVSEGLYLHVPDEEQLVAQVERLLTLRPAWASQLAVAYTIMPGIHRDVAVLAGRLRRFAHSMATVRRRAGVNVPWLLWSGLSGSPLPERASSPWFICTGGEVQVATSTENAMPAQWIAQSGVQELSQRLSYLLKASNELAKEQGACPWFNETTYAKGILPIDTYKKDLDAIANEPLHYDWEALRESIKTHGLRNSTLSALMPSETSSQISNATNGIEPPRGYVSIKASKDGILRQVVPDYEHLHDAYELLWEMPGNDGYLQLVGIMQKFIDQSISANTNYDPSRFPSGKVPMQQLLKDLLTAYKFGVKTLYYQNTRDGAEDAQDDLVPSIQDDGCESGACKI